MKGKKVAVIEGTTSIHSVNMLGARTVVVSSKEEALSRLRSKGLNKVDAFVYDMPGISVLARKNNDMKATGILFSEQNYGIAMPQGSPYRERINIALLRVLKNNYQKIYKDHFQNL